MLFVASCLMGAVLCLMFSVCGGLFVEWGLACDSGCVLLVVSLVVGCCLLFDGWHLLCAVCFALFDVYCALCVIRWLLIDVCFLVFVVCRRLRVVCLFLCA